MYVWRRRRAESVCRDLLYIKKTWNLKKTKQTNSRGGLWMLDKDPIFFEEEIEETVVYYRAARFSASHTFQSLDPNHE